MNRLDYMSPSNMNSALSSTVLQESTNDYNQQYFDFEKKVVKNRYLIEHRIGYGAFGEIYTALDFCTNEVYFNFM